MNVNNIEIYDDSGPIDIAEIDAFENLVSRKFPNKYRELLSLHNALRTEKRIFPFIDRTSGEEDTRDISFYGFGDNIADYDSIIRVQDHDEIGHDGIITFGRSANGDYIGFDYKTKQNENDPIVVLMFHDRRDISNKMLVNYVADSFEEFLGMLYKPED